MAALAFPSVLITDIMMDGHEENEDSKEDEDEAEGEGEDAKMVFDGIRCEVFSFR